MAASTASAPPDPRIGIDFIALATSRHIRPYYTLASKLYFWGFTTKNMTRFHRTIQDGVDRLGPFIGNKSHREWSRELKHENPAVLDSIRGFWIRNDPLPSAPENERLLEHWQRIAYARTHYTRNKHSVYGCDDRGTIYVKYGPPDYVHKGLLIFESAFATNLADDIEDQTKGMGASDNESKNIQFLVRTAELQFFSPAEYEVWIYHNLSNKNPDGNIYLFGKPRDGGYRELYGLEAFIRQRAYSVTKGTSTSAGALLQAMYYQQFSVLSSFFGNIYQNLMSLYATSSNTRPTDALYTGEDNKQKLKLQYLRSPEQVSSFAHRVTPLPIKVRMFRMLSTKDQPRLLVFVYSQPQKVMLAQYIKKHELTKGTLVHHVTAYDSTWHLITQKRKLGPVNVNNFLNDSTLNYARTYALVPQQTGEHLVFAARLKRLNANYSSVNSSSSVSSNKLVAAGHVYMEPSPKLSTRPDRLVMSDPVIGYQKGRQSMSVDSLFVPFYVPPRNTIAYGKNLWLHFELYHLHPDSKGVVHFNLNYSLDREKNYHPKKGEPRGKTNASLDLQMTGRGTRAIPESGNQSQ